MVKQTVSTWDTLQSHPIAKELDAETQLALLCEYIDLRDELQGMPLADFIGAYFDPGAATEVETDTEVEDDTPEPGVNGDGAKVAAKPEAVVRPASMLGLRVVYKFPGRNVLADENGVTRDSGNTVSFTDVEGEPWSSISRDKVYPIDPKNHREIHITPREAKEFKGWLAGTPSKAQPEGAVLRSLFVEFVDHPDRVAFAIMNGKRPYVDRFVSLPDNGFEDDQKPTTRLFGEHCFRVRNVDYIVSVVTP